MNTSVENFRNQVWLLEVYTCEVLLPCESILVMKVLLQNLQTSKIVTRQNVMKYNYLVVTVKSRVCSQTSAILYVHIKEFLRAEYHQRIHSTKKYLNLLACTKLFVIKTVIYYLIILISYLFTSFLYIKIGKFRARFVGFILLKCTINFP